MWMDNRRMDSLIHLFIDRSVYSKGGLQVAHLPLLTKRFQSTCKQKLGFACNDFTTDGKLYTTVLSVVSEINRIARFNCRVTLHQHILWVCYLHHSQKRHQKEVPAGECLVSPLASVLKADWVAHLAARRRHESNWNRTGGFWAMFFPPCLCMCRLSVMFVVSAGLSFIVWF